MLWTRSVIGFLEVARKKTSISFARNKLVNEILGKEPSFCKNKNSTPLVSFYSRVWVKSSLLLPTFKSGTRRGEHACLEIAVKIDDNWRCQTIFDFELLCSRFLIILDFWSMKRNFLHSWRTMRRFSCILSTQSSCDRFKIWASLLPEGSVGLDFVCWKKLNK